MTRLLVHVEGQTEEQFVNDLLAPYLYDFGYNRYQRPFNRKRPSTGTAEVEYGLGTVCGRILQDI